MTKYSAVCEYVEDGDTFKTAKGTWIRLANVCAPDKSDGGYEKAKGTLKNLILGKPITYEEVGTSYERKVAEVWVNDLSVNAYMRELGYTCP